MKLTHYISYSIIFSCYFVSADVEFDNPNNAVAFSYVYSHGLNASELQAGKYIPEFTASTDEVIKRAPDKGITVLQEPVSAPNFAEIRLRNNHDKLINPLTCFKRAIYAFARYAHLKYYGVYVDKMLTKTNSLAGYWVNPFALNIGQEQDVAILENTYNKHINEQRNLHPDKEIGVVCYGASRGAATTFNFLAKHKPVHAKIAVLEGCFDSVEHVLQNRYGLLASIFGASRLGKFLSCLCKYRPHGLSPINLVAEFPKDVPVLFITSRKDREVPMECTLELVDRLRKTGHHDVHLLILEHSSHPAYMYDHPEDTLKYAQAVHAFYKKYGAPYNQALAYDGEKYLNNY